MKINRLHNWNLNYAQAVDLQKQLADTVKITPIQKPLKTIAGVDCAVSKDKKSIIAAVVVLDYARQKPVETAYAVRRLDFPYIPGLLSFREVPACIAAAEQLDIEPDCLIVDGQGIAHPRRLGIACHLGLFLDTPTIGCAKSRLVGAYQSPLSEKGEKSVLADKGEPIGCVLRTRTNVKPVFVSVGHLCTLEQAVEIVLNCSVRYRLPEPTRIAHQTAAKLKAKLYAG